VATGSFSADVVNFKVRGLWRGIDQRHVLWRLETVLRKLSFDFEPAAACLSLLFSTFNYSPDSDEKEDDSVVGCTDRAGRTVSTPDEAMRCFMNNEMARGNGALGEEIVQKHAQQQLLRGTDGARMPATAVQLMLRWLGLPRYAQRLRPLEPTTTYFTTELDGLEKWFSVGMARQRCRRIVKTKHGQNHRVRLLREDGRVQHRQQIAAVGESWSKCKKNQQRPIVANALLASYEAKRFLVQELGPGATSLGTVGVERGHFVDKIQEKNPTSIWATNACKQYRAVVKWKKCVQATMRTLLVRFGKKEITSKRAQHVLEGCAGLLSALTCGSRTPLLTLVGEPEQPDDCMLNVGLDEFRLKLVDARVFSGQAL
jgi:hypothetical protein